MNRDHGRFYIGIWILNRTRRFAKYALDWPRIIAPPECFQEGPLLIDPLRPVVEAGACGEFWNFIREELVGGFGPDSFTGSQGTGEICRRNPDGLPDTREQMHFDALFRFVITHLMNEVRLHKIPAELAIYPAQEIQVEGGRHTGGIVVGGEHPAERFHQIEAD